MNETPLPMSSQLSTTAPDPIQAGIIDIVDKLVSELREGQVYRQVKLDDSLEIDLGIGSLERVELLVRLEEAFDVQLPDEVMSEANTLRDLKVAITSAGPKHHTEVARKPLNETQVSTVPTASLSIVEALEWHAEHSPNRTQIHLKMNNGKEKQITNKGLWESSVKVANGLFARGVRRHETIAIMLRTEEAFFSSFFGVLLAGGIPVPMYPPFRADRIEEYAQRQVSILQNANAKLLITFSDVERLTALLISQVPSLSSVITTEALSYEGATVPAGRIKPRINNADPALIQYTSGSTGNPKGVLLTHANLLANIRALRQRLDISSADIAVSWLPLYHDMGLIGAWLGTMYAGAPLILMSPMAFLARPSRWLWTLHEYQGTISPAPNFAYDLCSQRIPDSELEGLDLGSIRMLLNGSEPVKPESLNRFIARFVSFGLKPESLTPVYGLAECAVGLTTPNPGEGPKIDRIKRDLFQKSAQAHPCDIRDDSALQFVSSGRALPDHEVRIVDKAGQPNDERLEGRVQFRGPSATAGYYRNTNETQKLVNENGWLETGDLGYLADGELYLTGRKKDLIIKGGRNIHPHEAEEIVGQIKGIRKGCVVAFGITDNDLGTERFVLIAETRITSPEEHEQLRLKITDQLITTLGLPPDIVIITKPGAIYKTSSGKVRRSATRDSYLSGHLSRGQPSLVVQWIRIFLSAGTAWLGRWTKRVLQTLFTGYVISLLLLTGPLLWTLLALVKNGRWINRLVGFWTLSMLALSGCRVKTNGLDKLRDLGPAVFVANHASYLDPILMVSILPHNLHFAAKSRLTTYPILSTAIRKGRHIVIEFEKNLSQQIKEARSIEEILHRGESLFVFPEGAVAETPQLLPFRLGAFRAAVETKRPVVPITISGTREILSSQTLLLRPGTITISVHNPIIPNNKNWQEIVKLRDLTKSRIQKELNRSSQL